MINASYLAAEYKRLGYDKYYAWDKFIIDRALKPEMNAKEFYAIFESVTAAKEPAKNKPDIIATHFDNLLNINCQIITRENGVSEIIWENGHTGSYPPCNPPEVGRYILLDSNKAI
jgi:hypothetical protein